MVRNVNTTKTPNGGGSSTKEQPAAPSNIVTIDFAARAANAILPSDHKAQIILFTGVQIVRHTDDGPLELRG